MAKWLLVLHDCCDRASGIASRPGQWPSDENFGAPHWQQAGRPVSAPLLCYCFLLLFSVRHCLPWSLCLQKSRFLLTTNWVLNRISQPTVREKKAPSEKQRKQKKAILILMFENPSDLEALAPKKQSSKRHTATDHSASTDGISCGSATVSLVRCSKNLGRLLLFCRSYPDLF